jgi:ABC-type glycerol-3-phosphate transport system permease component
VPEAATTFAFGVFLLRQFAWQVFTRVALALLRSAYSSESYGPIMAGAELSAVPLLIVFLVANRRIVEGVRLSGLKG